MALRNILKDIIAGAARPSVQQAPDLQVDFSHTQWRHAQMEQLVRNYHQACDTCEGAPA